jgi:hypothetical protein
MRVKYVGPYDAVEVPELGLTIEQGEIVEVDDAIGKRMAASPDWQVTSRKKGEED